MGRKASKWANLPPGMRARPRGRKVFYYLDMGGKPRKEQPLGSDYVAAVQKWAELTAENRPADGEYTFVDAVSAYKDQVIPTKEPQTQSDNLRELKNLLKFFGDPPAPLEKIEPVHVRQYLDWRVKEARATAQTKGKKVDATYGQTRANREKSLLSHIWNFAREQGMTARENPCRGVKGFRERGRDTVVAEDHWDQVLAHADQPLAFALRLAALTGQRPADVRRMSEADIKGGVLHVHQAKGGVKLRIEISGALQELMAEITAYKAQFKVRTLALLVDERGQPLSSNQQRYRFDKARKEAGVPKAAFQIRDLRPTAATQVDDEKGIRAAQALLGHSTEQMTSHYVRHRIGKKIAPVR